jgi:hypothetical protein
MRNSVEGSTGTTPKRWARFVRPLARQWSVRACGLAAGMVDGNRLRPARLYPSSIAGGFDHQGLRQHPQQHLVAPSSGHEQEGMRSWGPRAVLRLGWLAFFEKKCKALTNKHGMPFAGPRMAWKPFRPSSGFLGLSELRSSVLGPARGPGGHVQGAVSG